MGLECTSDKYIVRVKDSGIGISPEMLSSIFEVFTQEAHPIQRRHGGLGIGLSLVKMLVELHDGSVQAFSAGLNQGSEFVVCLPRPASNDLYIAPHSSQLAMGRLQAPGRFRILVVDDNVDAAMMISAFLEIKGHEVTTVHDGLDAVTSAANVKPNIIFLDIGLPGIDGYEAARRIRSDSEFNPSNCGADRMGPSKRQAACL